MIRLSDLVQGLVDEQTNGAGAAETTQVPRQAKSTHQPLHMSDFPALRAFCEQLQAVSGEVLTLIATGSHHAEREAAPPADQPLSPKTLRSLIENQPLSPKAIRSLIEVLERAEREAAPPADQPLSPKAIRSLIEVLERAEREAAPPADQPPPPAPQAATPAPSLLMPEEPTPPVAPRMPPAMPRVQMAPAAPEVPQQDAAEVWYTNACDLVAEAIVCASVEDPFDLTPVWTIITDVLDTPGALDTFYRLACSCTDKAGQFSVHSVNVATYAMKIGVGLQYDREALLRLGVLGLVHDIGQARLPAELLAKQGTLTAEEWQLMREHPRQSASILRQWGEAYAWMADIVVQEHEREGGQGYPEGLRGDKIHAYAKIIGLADVYEALTHVRSYRKGFTPFEAVKEILASQKDFFPMPILKSMVAQLSVFPLQSYVLLNSKAIGQVVATHEAAPLRPIVRLLYDSQRKPVQGEKLVDLRGNQLLYITDTLSAEALAAYAS